MFTGIVESTGHVLAKESGPKSVRLEVEVGPQLVSDAQLGASIAVNGCCLTVTRIAGTTLTFDMLQETERCTNLAQVQPGHLVNLERSLRADARLGGHFVTGHIDGTGTISRWELVGQDYELEILYPRQHGRLLVPKGCIAVDGMSLTVVQVMPDRFSVWIIPHTRAVTALNQRIVGDLVNLEFDLLAKYAQKILST
jgi:riboflavin synthase